MKIEKIKSAKTLIHWNCEPHENTKDYNLPPIHTLLDRPRMDGVQRNLQIRIVILHPIVHSAFTSSRQIIVNQPEDRIN